MLFSCNSGLRKYLFLTKRNIIEHHIKIPKGLLWLRLIKIEQEIFLHNYPSQVEKVKSKDKSNNGTDVILEKW